MKKKLLWVGDAACPSGFARVTHETLNVLQQWWDITVLGINYRGDPHDYPYPIYSAAAGGDWMGVKRLIWMCDLVRPDVIVLQNDPWNVMQYLQQIKRVEEYQHTPIVAAMAIDGKNIQSGWFQHVDQRPEATIDHAIFWTNFGLEQAQLGGYTGTASVIPLGVDVSQFRPIDQKMARKSILPEELRDVFIVGNINRNQSRKRWDLTIRYFAEWVKSRHIDDAYLYLHAAPTGETSCDVDQLAQYYGVLQRLIFNEPPAFYGATERTMLETYACFDVAVTTTQGEGFGLTTLEAMACGIPVIAPNWAALGEWAKDAIWLVNCTSTAVGQPYVNVIGGVPDEAYFIQALQRLYSDPKARETNKKAGLERANHPMFRWGNIGRAFHEALEEVVARPREAVTRTMVSQSV